QAEDGIRDFHVTGVQTCALPILLSVADANLEPRTEYRSVRGTPVFAWGAAGLAVIGVGLSAAFGISAGAAQADDQLETARDRARSEERRVGRGGGAGGGAEACGG